MVLEGIGISENVHAVSIIWLTRFSSRNDKLQLRNLDLNSMYRCGLDRNFDFLNDPFHQEHGSGAQLFRPVME